MRPMTASPPGEERARLLELICDYIVEHGVAQLTLRALAGAIGSNNRMLLYYFTSKEQLMIEALRQTDTRFPRFAAAMSELRQPGGDLRATLHSAWAAIADPASRGHLRLFFETFGLAVHQPDIYGALLGSVGTEWVEHVAGHIGDRGVEPATAQILARELVSGWRGLEMDLLSDRDPEVVSAVARSAIDALCQRVEQLRPQGQGVGEKELGGV
jgi:AcrR family transcriptional regulator